MLNKNWIMSSPNIKIVFKETFLTRLSRQVDYIAKDSPARATKFKNKLLKEIRKIPNRPYSYRKSIYFEKEEIRDLIIKGYTIVFRITDKRIEIFGFVKYQNRPVD